jgi:hypothetical protein
MKNALIIIAVACAVALTASAQEGKKKGKMTDEQKTLHKEMVAKYDTNKDGKLDKEERAKISQEDKDKMEKAGMGHKKGEGKKEKKS